MRRRRRNLEVMSEMNLTNLIDMAFTLLIAFMLVAPMLKHGIELRLPQVAAGQITTETTTITIVVARSPEEGLMEPIYIEDQRVTLEEMEEVLRQRMDLYESISVVVEGDRQATYEPISRVLARIQRMGITSIGLIFDPDA